MTESITRCKICDGPTDDVGAVPFATAVAVEDVRPAIVDASNELVPYLRCRDCGFLFTAAFDEWTVGDFLSRIYNDEYDRVDPECADVRPRTNALNMARSLQGIERLRILDYGGGDGAFARCLIDDHGAVDVDTYDGLLGPPLRDRFYDVVTCFETLEHLPRPRRAAYEIASHLALGGLAVLTTVLQPEPPPNLDWWYVGPRNGHVSLFSRRSLQLLFESCDMRVQTQENGLVHVAKRVR